MLEIDKVGAMSFKEATPDEAALQFLQGEVGYGLFAGGTQIGFALATGGIEDLAGIIEQDAVLFARSDFERSKVFGYDSAGGAFKGVIVDHTPAVKFDH